MDLDMKELNLEGPNDEGKSMQELNIDLGVLTSSPGLHLPPIAPNEQPQKNSK